MLSIKKMKNNTNRERMEAVKPVCIEIADIKAEQHINLAAKSSISRIAHNRKQEGDVTTTKC